MNIFCKHKRCKESVSGGKVEISGEKVEISGKDGNKWEKGRNKWGERYEKECYLCNNNLLLV